MRIFLVQKFLKILPSKGFFLVSLLIILFWWIHLLFFHQEALIFKYFLIGISGCFFFLIIIFLETSSKLIRCCLKLCFSIVFTIISIEILGSEGSFAKIWSCSLYLLINLIDNEDSEWVLDISIPLFSFYIMMETANSQYVVLHALCIILSFLLIYLKHQRANKTKREIQTLKNSVKELEDFKQIIFDYVEIDLLILGFKKENSVIKRTPKKFLGLCFDFYKKKEEKIGKTSETIKKPNFFVKALNERAKIKYVKTEKPDPLENFLEYLQLFDKTSIKTQKSTVSKITSSFSQKEVRDTSSFLMSLFEGKFNAKIFPKKILARIAEITFFKLGENLLIIEKNKPTEKKCSISDKEDEFLKLKRKIDQKDHILATISHDMRSPLNGIIFYIKAAKESLNEATKLKKLDYALVNTEILLSLVNDLLDFSRNKNGTLNLNLHKFLLQDVLDYVAQVMRIEAYSRGIDFLIENYCPSSFVISSDEVRLKQVLINLVSNAIKFTFKGFVRIKVSLVEFDEKKTIKFEVIDTGLGISPEILPLLTKPFATFDSPLLKVNKNGIGLGLFICKTIIGSLGPIEELFIYSEEAKGSKFGFLISANKEERRISQNIPESITEDFEKLFIKEVEAYHEENALDSDMRDFLIKSKNISLNSFYNIKLPSNSFESLKTRRKSKFSAINLQVSPIVSDQNKNEENYFQFSSMKQNHNVLIVDDQGFNLMILAEILRSYQATTISFEKACNGLIAIDLFNNHNMPNGDEDPFEMIFMDCEMPIMGGIEAAKEIRKKISEEGYSNVKIIICSGDDKMDDTDGNLVFDEWITKPVNKEKVFACLRKHILESPLL